MRKTMNVGLVVLALFITSISASAGQTMVLLKGTVTGSVAPGKVDLVFTDESGAKIRSSSGTDGKYQAVLKAGHHYSVLITDQDLQRFTMAYDAPASEKFLELSYDFVARPAAPVAVEPLAKQSKKKAKTKKSTRR
jgi:hypothetical protein